MIRLKEINNRGFTILELIIATTVFGVMLLVATTGMLQIGRAYYKGLITTKTQETTRNVVDDIARTVQFGGPDKVWATPDATEIGTTGVKASAYCIGNQRYSYVIGKQLNPKSEFKHVLWYDQKDGGSPCVPVNLASVETDPSTVSGNKAKSRELLSSGMRLVKFEIRTVGERSASVNVKILFGDDDLIQNLADPNTSNCVSNNKGGQFCAFSELSTFVTRRL